MKRQLDFIKTLEDSSSSFPQLLSSSPVSNDRVKPLSISLSDALRNIRALGKGSLDIAGLQGMVKTA